MTIEHYRNFIAIVEAGTISNASRLLKIAQPALSNQLKSFEKWFGAQLIIRNARHLQLTDSGQILYEKAKSMCALEDVTRKEINELISGTRGTLWLGLTPAYPDPHISDVLLDFYKIYPEIRYEIFENSSDQVLTLLKNKIIEVGIVRTPQEINYVFQSYLDIEEHLVVIFHRNNPWISPALSSIPISLLRNVPLSVSKGFHQKVTELCLRAGFSPLFFSICSSRSIALMWANQGISVSIVPTASPLEYENEEFCCRPLIGDHVSTKRSVVVIRDQPLSIITRNFLNFIIKRSFSNLM